MTLIVPIANPRAVVVIADRRLSNLLDDGTAEVMDDDSHKLNVVTLRNARLVCGFTGYASGPEPRPDDHRAAPGARSSSAYIGVPRHGHHRTGFWLNQRLYDLAHVDNTWEAVGEALRDAATSELGHVADELSIYFNGYHYGDEGAYAPVCVRISNRSQQGTPLGRFELQGVSVREYAYTLAYGTNPLAARAWEPLLDLALRDRPPYAWIGKGRELFARAADQSDVIGRNLTSIILPARPEIRWSWGYHSDLPTNRLLRPGSITVLEDEELAILEAWEERHDAFLSGPKLRTNAWCFCGSETRYARCHGKPPKASSVW